MFKVDTLKNGLTLITIPMPHLDSVTTLVAVGAGSRYETKKINGISHFLEHMFFKGSTKYPSAQEIANIVDGIGAVNNAGTEREWTDYWIKSSAKNIELATDVISSMLSEPIFAEEEIEKEKGVIAEELRMYRDMPSRYVDDLYMQLQFGDQPLGWDIGGKEQITDTFTREDFNLYMDSLYSSENMVLVYAGNIPSNIKEIAEKYFGKLPSRASHKFVPYKKTKQTKAKVNIFYKDTDQANLILGVEGYDRHNPKRYPAAMLGVILGAGMSSRLFIEVREKRGLAYSVSADHSSFVDTGIFAAFAGLKLEKIEEGLEVVKTELERTVAEKVTDEELKKAKEMIRGHLALRQESTNFLAEHFALKFILDRELETFDEYLRKMDAVTKEDIQAVAQELIQPDRYNLQIIAPLKDTAPFEKILNS